MASHSAPHARLGWRLRVAGPCALALLATACSLPPAPTSQLDLPSPDGAETGRDLAAPGDADAADDTAGDAFDSEGEWLAPRDAASDGAPPDGRDATADAVPDAALADSLSPAGTPCRSDGECATGPCVDGVCCRSLCEGPCVRCDLPAAPGDCLPIAAGADPDDECPGEGPCGTSCDGAGACGLPPNGAACGLCLTCDGAGQCVAAPPGSDPGEQCRADDVATCGQDGACDGAGACGRYAPGTPCGAPTCDPQGHRVVSLCGAAGCETTVESCAGFRCVEGRCPTTCGSDADCQDTLACAAGVCQGRQPAGSPCAFDAECASTHCVDGVCCTSDCSGPCERCDGTATPGECHLAPAGSDVRGDCEGEAGCAGHCDGAGGCTFPDATQACGVCAACDGRGQCAPVGAATDPFADCAAIDASCAGACDGAGACAFPGADRVCAGDGGLCAGRCSGMGLCVFSAAGARCGHCAVCDGSGGCGPVAAGADPNGDCPAGELGCSALCDGTGGCHFPEGRPCGTCSRCGGSGVCEPVAAGLDPYDQCEREPLALCGHDGACDGAGSCRHYANGTVCADARCADGQIARYACLDEACQPSDAECGGYVCQGDTACRTTCTGDLHCMAGYYCQGGLCRGSLEIGAVCAYDVQCASRHCVDGRCCGNACDGPCERCDLASAEGQCTAVPRGSDPDQECVGSDPCGGACDGARGCAFPEAATPCGLCRRCDGAGACVPVAAGTDPDAQCAGAGVCAGSCNGSGGCGFPGSGVSCGTCRHCDAAGRCVDEAAGADPYGECGALSCEGYYAGWDDTACRERASLGAAAVGCSGTGACQTAAERCPSQPPGPTELTCAEPCRGPDPLSCVGTAPGACLLENGVSCGECRACTHGACEPVAAGSDPFGQCGPLSCAGYYWGWQAEDCFQRAAVPAAEAHCDGAGACLSPAALCPTQPKGTASGHCAAPCRTPDGATCHDGVAGTCLTPSGVPCGLCQACLAGECRPVPDGSDPFADCAGTLAACTGRCAAGACAYPGAETACGAGTCEGAFWTGAACDGAGDCAADTPLDCSPHACAPAGCRNPCTADADCVDGWRCAANGACVPIPAPALRLSATPGCGEAPLSVTLSALNDGGPVDRYTWDFGDGSTTAGGASVSHRYALAGTYSPRVTAEGPGGTTTVVAPGLVRLIVPGWSVLRPLPPCVRLHALWQDASGAVAWAVGAAGVAMRRDATGAWSLVPSGVTSDLYAVSGSAAGVWLVGTGGVVLRVDETGLTRLDPPIEPPVDWRGVYVQGEAAFVVGNGGYFASYAPETASWQIARPHTEDLSAISGELGLLGTTLVAAVDADAARLLVSTDAGSTWTTVTNPALAQSHLTRVVVTRANPLQAFALGATRIVEFAAGLGIQESYAAPAGTTLRDLAADTGGTELRAVGDERLLRLAATGWTSTPMPTGAPEFGTALAVGGPLDVRVGTARGSVWHLSPAGWQAELPAYEGCGAMHDVWGLPGTALLAVGDAGSLWTFGAEPSPTYEALPTEAALRAVWGAAPNDVFAVGDAGQVWHFDGAAWLPADRLNDASLNDVFGFAADAVFAVGGDAAGAVVLAFDGTGWGDVTPDELRVPESPLRALWGAQPDDVWFVGRGARLRLVGGDWLIDEWVADPSGQCCPDESCAGCADGTRPDYRAVGGSGPDDVSLVGMHLAYAWVAAETGECAGGFRCERRPAADAPAAWHFAGTTWQAVPLPTGMDLPAGLHAASAADHYLLDGAPGTRALAAFDGTRWTPFDSAGPAPLAAAGSLFGVGSLDLYAPAAADHEATLLRYQSCLP